MADDWLNIALRFGLYLDLTILFGVSLFGVQALRPDHRATAIARRYVRVLGVTAALGIVLSLWSFVVMAKAMTGATDYAELTSHVFGMMLTTTAVGLAWMVRLAALAGCLVVVARLRKHPAPHFGVCAGLGAVALVTVTWAGHGAMDDGARGYLHLAFDIAHVLAAGAWVGALTAFVLLASTRQAAALEAVEILSHTSNGFARLGALIVATLLSTGTFNYLLIVGPTINGLVSTLYGRLLLIKLALFALMLGLAAANRYRLSPRLEAAVRAADHASAVMALRRSLITEASLAVLILALVAWLGVLSPPGT
ncbi:copper homeostasis membrane protein CopD (plasmid) [Ralstonia solanacearum]|uniref:Copper homeostasis membrane protein CopD n=1 Tax=Ralstonia chuxiongensis TaxID=2957504 RepID=A0AA42BL62_9RALS|nr:copper homeostasis membrane protein CopD [Ralstonia chuxiongensis]MCP1175843.1 copper homeostasis membrane protein CopD [Ralstonia chuxiongensis]QKL94789.1 copper homeostasis membrane protein CopD [Ralstonia solanacearum]QKL99867.1 copper homeostasis membrane protein CopD [Ralstonia solanacearum]QLR10929.1 copper homeostasis membrane protein CopD [Ralstonia solanacearum]